MYLVPQWDRYWLLGLLCSIILLTASIGLSVWYLASLFGLPQKIGLPPLTDLGSFGGDVILTGGFGGLSLIFMSRAARRRVRARRAAVRGDVDAVPLSSIQPDPAKVPRNVDLPLMLPWRRRPRGREWQAIAAVTVVLSSVVAVSVAVVVVPIALGWTGLMSLLDYALHKQIADTISLLLIIFFEFVGAVASAIALVRALTSRLGPDYGVMADEEGIRSLHLKGQGPRLRWSDVRLVEVSQLGRGNAEWIFTVYSPTANVSWHEFKKPPRKRMQPEISREEFAQRQQGLLALIDARTGLQPRTFSSALMRDEEVARQPMRKYLVLAYSIGYGVAGALFLLAIAALTLRLTHNWLLDGYAAATTLVAGVWVAVMLRRTLTPRQEEPAAAAPYALPVPASFGSESFAATYRRALGSRLQDAFVGLVLVPNVVPAFGGMASHPPTPVLAFATHAVASMLFLVAMVGVAAVVHAIVAGTGTLIVGEASLCERIRRTETRIAWHDIVVISATLEKGQANSFTILSHTGESITLPVCGAVWSMTEPIQQPVSPEELAALVVARSGVQLTTKEA